MNACGISFGMDIGACISSMAAGWVPDWLAPLLPYWPWFAVVLALGIAYRLAGVPGIAAAAGAVGFILGRRSVKDDAHEHVTGHDAAPPVTPKKKRKTLF